MIILCHTDITQVAYIIYVIIVINILMCIILEQSFYIII